MSEQDWMDRCEHAEYDLDEAGTKIADLEHENAVLTRALVDAAQDLNDCRHVPQCVTQNELLCGNDLCLEILKADAHAELAKEAKDE